MIFQFQGAAARKVVKDTSDIVKDVSKLVCILTFNFLEVHITILNIDYKIVVIVFEVKHSVVSRCMLATHLASKVC